MKGDLVSEPAAEEGAVMVCDGGGWCCVLCAVLVVAKTGRVRWFDPGI